MTAPTLFQTRVYEETKLIPLGKVASYKYVANRLNTSPRAVAQALSCNPFREVPCHRVVGVNGKLTGFYKETTDKALGKKKTMLENEGVVFDDNVVSKSSFLV